MLPAVQLGSGKEGPGNATADASILDVIARSLFRRNRSGYVRPAFRSSLDTIAGNHGAIAGCSRQAGARFLLPGYVPDRNPTP